MDTRVGLWRKRAVKAALARQEDREHRWHGYRVGRLASDCFAMHRLLWECKPEVLVEIGTQNGGSALFLAACAPRVVAIAMHEMPARPADPRITYLTGNAVSPEIMARLRTLLGEHACSVVIDGNHHAEQVDRELELYAPLVSAGQALIMGSTHVDVLDLREFRAGGGPLRAMRRFMPRHPEFRPAEGIEPYVTTSFFGYWLRRG